MAAASPPPKSERQTTTPFLLKLFYKQDSWHRLDEFAPNVQLPPHLQIYTWQSCSLRELTHLLTSALPSLLPSPAAGTRLAYRLIYPDTKPPAMESSRPGRYLSKDLGSVVVGADDSNNMTNGTGPATLEGDAERTLQDARFIIGDYISCAILPPQADGSIAPPPVAPGPAMRGGFGGPPPRGPENGYGYRGSGPRGGFDRGPAFPSGEWRRGERLPDRGYGGGGGGGYRGRGRGRGW